MQNNLLYITFVVLIYMKRKKIFNEKMKNQKIYIANALIFFIIAIIFIFQQRHIFIIYI